MDKVQEKVSKIGLLDSDLMQKAQGRLDNLTKPQGSLGRLEELAKQKIALKFNGLRHGEKINERLVADEEIKYIHDIGGMVVIKYNHISNKKIDVNAAKVLNKQEIRKLLYSEGILNENK